MKRRIANIIRIVMCAAVLTLAFIPSAHPTMAADAPTLFHGDEPWYKDSVSPLVTRGGIRYVPSDIFNMLDRINVEIYNDNNLLIENISSGQYASILFLERSAVINDVLYDDINIFRDNGVYYVDAAFIADAVGVSIEEYSLPSGGTGLRLYDDSAKLAIEQLLAPYSESDQGNGESDDSDFNNYGFNDYYNDSTSGVADKGVKKIYVLSKEPAVGEYFKAKKSLDESGIEYTLFLDGSETIDHVIEVCAAGEYGIDCGAADFDPMEVVDRVNGINTGFYNLTGRLTHLTLATGDDAVDSALMSAGYRIIKPDFSVSVANDAYQVMEDINEYLSANNDKENNYCTLMLTDCWQTTKMVELLGELDRTEYLVCGYKTDGKDG